MVEVLFGEGEACSMKYAKRNAIRRRKRKDDPAAVTGNPPQFPYRSKDCATVPGTPDEVVCLAYQMDIGDIRQPADSSYRQELILNLRTQNRKQTDRERIECKEQLLRYQEYARLQRLLADGNGIRIWYGKAPYEYCGLCWLCHELGETKAEVTVVELPEYELLSETGIVIYKSWSEMEAEKFAGFLDRQKTLTMLERKMYAMEWIEAMETNSPLRAVVNGKLLSVPEDFYDFLILRRMTEQPEKEARILGDIIGTSQIAVRDEWFAYRIQRMMEEGKIQAAEDSENEYMRMIYLNPGGC